MPRPPYLLGALVVAALGIVVAVLVYPHSKRTSDALVLTSAQTAAWTQLYCIPDGTRFTYSLDRDRGGGARLRVHSPSPPTLEVGSSEGTTTNGSGLYCSDGTMQFDALNASSPSVQVVVDLSLALSFSYLFGTPHSGPGAG